MAYLQNDVNEALLQAWSRLLLHPPDKLCHMLSEAVEQRCGVATSPRATREFIENFQKNCHNPAFVERLPRRVIKYDSSIIVITKPNFIDYRFTKPIEFELDEQIYAVPRHQWKHLVPAVCEVIAKQNPEDFHLVMEASGRGGDYFSHQKRTKDHCLIADTGIYVDTHLSANNAKNLCDDLCCKFGYAYPLKVNYAY